jgi:hypothetical protein
MQEMIGISDVPSIEWRFFSGYKSPVGLVKEALIQRFFFHQESSYFKSDFGFTAQHHHHLKGEGRKRYKECSE